MLIKGLLAYSQYRTLLTDLGVFTHLKGGGVVTRVFIGLLVYFPISNDSPSIRLPTDASRERVIAFFTP